MKNIADRELLTVILDSHKFAASNLTTLVLESVNPTLRADATDILNNTFRHQKQIFDIMSQKGWYPVENATSQAVSKVQQQLNSQAM